MHSQKDETLFNTEHPNLFAERVLHTRLSFTNHKTTAVNYLDKLKNCIRILHFISLRGMQKFIDKYLYTPLYNYMFVIYIFNKVM